MKKSIVLAAMLVGSFIVGNVHADILGAISEGTSTYNQAIKFKSNIDAKYKDITDQLKIVKTQKGGEKAQGMTIILDDGLGMMDDVSSILLSVISTLSEAMNAIPVSKAQEIGDKMTMLLYANPADKDNKALTGPVGNVINVIKLMKSITAQLKASADKAVKDQAIAKANPAAAKPAAAQDDLLAF